MDNQNTEIKTARPKVEHVALTKESSQKLNKWLEQINTKKKIRISRKDLVNWFIENSEDNLSNAEVNAILENFYDEEAYLRQLLRDVRKAKEDGKTEPIIDVSLRTKKTERKETLVVGD